jgi:hypothetical protein
MQAFSSWFPPGNLNANASDHVPLQMSAAKTKSGK